MSRCRALVVAAFLALSAAIPATAGAADDDLLLPGEKVRAILAGGESRTLAVAGIEGGRYTLSVKAVGASRAVPRFEVLAPDGSALGDRGRVRESARGATARNVRVDRTGLWRVTLSTSADRGGEVEFAVKASLPATRKLSGETTGAAAGEPASGTVSFPALPGATIDLALAFASKDAGPIDVSLVAPGGSAAMAAASGDGGKAVLQKLVVTSFGVHEVRVAAGEGAAGGRFRGTVRFRGPAKRKGLSVDAVEAFPEVTGLSPDSVANDGIRNLTLAGFGFSTRHRFQLSRNGATALSAPLAVIGAASARVDADLEGFVPQTYDVALLLPAGRRRVLPWTLDVTNLSVAVLSQIPREASNEPEISFRLDGLGFDPGATVEVRRASDGLEIPVTSTSRPSHRVLEAKLRAPAYAVGVCDVTVVDGDGSRYPLPASLDLLGTRRASGSVRTVTDAAAYPAAAAFDDATGRLVVAVREGQRLAFLLVDSATWQVLDVYQPAPSAGSSRQVSPRVAFHPGDGTWALTWVDQTSATGTQRGFVRITGGADLDVVRHSGSVVDQRWVDLVVAAPDAVNGGWHVYWTEASSTLVGALRLLRFGSDGAAAAGGAVTLESDLVGGLYFPGASQRSDGRFVVVYLSVVDGAATQLGITRRVLEADGTTYLGRSVCAKEDEFALLSAPHVVAHPTDGSACVAFTYWDGARLRPATFRLSPVTASAGAIGGLAQEGVAPEGFLTALVWNAERGEYVASMETVAATVALRRIDPDGKIRVAYTLQSYEGKSGVVWAGRAAGSLGIARVCDGTDDGTDSPYVMSWQVRCASLR